MRRKSRPVRIYSDTLAELQLKFPNVRMPDLFDIMYRSSLLRVESILRNKKKRD